MCYVRKEKMGINSNSKFMATKTATKGRSSAKKRAGPRTKASKTLAKSPAKRGKVKKVMGEYKEGKLHSGRKSGPKVTSRKQAIAIALSEAGASNNKRSSKKPSAKKKK
jgi:hypothetical protein